MVILKVLHCTSVALEDKIVFTSEILRSSCDLHLVVDACLLHTHYEGVVSSY